VQNGSIRKGHVVVMVAFGGGLSWGAAVWRWSGAQVGKTPVPAGSEATA